MATSLQTTVESPAERVAPLVAGDRLTRAEFERRYGATAEVKKAELIEGVVYMPSPVSHRGHASPHFRLITWLGIYEAATPGVEGGDNATIRLDLDNEPQPDAMLRIVPELGGQSRNSGDYVEGAPELVAEVTASSASYDLHDKLNAYRRNGVQQYVVWRVFDEALDWFVLREGRYEPVKPDGDGILRSQVFPGLWLDARSLITGDMARVLTVAQQGTTSERHTEFVRALQAPQGGGDREV